MSTADEAALIAPIFSDGRLRWACRRGMLELDLLLDRFVDVAHPHLPVQVQADFQRLLQEADQDLIGYLMGNAVCEDADLAYVIEAIRRAAVA